MDLVIGYAQDARGVNVLQLQGSTELQYQPIDTYFNNLRRVQAWYGGVQEAMLEGCVQCCHGNKMAYYDNNNITLFCVHLMFANFA